MYIKNSREKYDEQFTAASPSPAPLTNQLFLMFVSKITDLDELPGSTNQIIVND